MSGDETNPVIASMVLSLQMPRRLAMLLAGRERKFPIGIMGHPMREFAKGKWESAVWPSEERERTQREIPSPMQLRRAIVEEVINATP